MGRATTENKVLQNAAGATGNGVVWDVSGLFYLSLQVIGTFVGTVTFEGSNDGGVTWAAVPFVNAAGTNASSATAVGMFTTYFTGYSLLRARVSAWTSGTITVNAAGMGN